LIRRVSVRKQSLKRFINKKFSRFVVVGAVNTLLSYVIYIAALQISSYQVAYSAAYFLGILISYYLNTVFVFKCSLSLGKAFKYPVVYIVQYLLGIFLLIVLVEWLDVDVHFAPIAVIVLTIPVTYYLSRRIIEGGAGGK